jgi:hypothetical protein
VNADKEYAISMFGKNPKLAAFTNPHFYLGWAHIFWDTTPFCFTLSILVPVKSVWFLAAGILVCSWS